MSGAVQFVIVKQLPPFARTPFCTSIHVQMGFFSDMGDAHLLAVAQLGKQLTSLEVLANRYFRARAGDSPLGGAKVSPQGLRALGGLSSLQKFRCPGAPDFGSIQVLVMHV